jgi:hypothetical protein
LLITLTENYLHELQSRKASLIYWFVSTAFAMMIQHDEWKALLDAINKSIVKNLRDEASGSLLKQTADITIFTTDMTTLGQNQTINVAIATFQHLLKTLKELRDNLDDYNGTFALKPTIAQPAKQRLSFFTERNAARASMEIIDITDEEMAQIYSEKNKK